MSEELFMYAIVSAEAVKASNGARGKMAAQVGHAFCKALFDAMERFPNRVRDYTTESSPKSVLIASEAELFKLYDLYQDQFGIALIKDAARTVFPEPIITALGIGPILKSEREDILKNLKAWQ